MPPVVRRWSDGQTAIGHCSLQRYERLTVCCYLVKGYITLLLCLQNANTNIEVIANYVIDVLHFVNRGMFKR